MEPKVLKINISKTKVIWSQGRTSVMFRGQGSGFVLSVGKVLEVTQCNVEGS